MLSGTVKSARQSPWGQRLLAVAALAARPLAARPLAVAAVAAAGALGAVSLSPGAAEAAIRFASGVAVSFDAAESVLTVTPDGQHLVDLHHNDKTLNVAAVDPIGFPPGPCKRLVYRWNDAVNSAADGSEFRTLLGGMAAKGCTVAYIADDLGDPAAPLHLVSIAPAKP